MLFLLSIAHQPIDGIINNWTDLNNHKIWLVTNRHILYPIPPGIELCPLTKNYEEQLSWNIDIYLKNKNSLMWEKISLQQEIY